MLYLLLNNNPRSFQEGETLLQSGPGKGRAERSRKMKHILPILTAALALTASAAFAIDYYPEYYSNGTTSLSADGTVETVSYDNYQVIKTSYPNQGFWHDSYYKFRITGNNVDLYLTDYIDNVGDSFQKDALENKITKYGYFYLDSNDKSKINSSKVTTLSTDNRVQVGDPMKSPWNDNKITRYGYYLGTFNEGDEIEIFMEDPNGTGRSNTEGYIGGYGSGVTDASDVMVQYQQNLDYNAARKAMPLASLDTGNGHRVFYGVYAAVGDGGGTVGSPLPGGLQIALIAGLFGLGFYFVRRRKATVA